MPTYEYLCSSCQNKFEEFQRISEPALETCPSCGGKVKRLLSGGAGLLFKGSGFYKTDYRSDGYKKKAKEEKEKPSASTKAEKKKD